MKKQSKWMKFKEKHINHPYQEYLKTSWWNSRRLKFIKNHGYRCKLCKETNNLQIHHLNYSRLFNEKDKDLEILCGICHMVKHKLIDNKISEDALEIYTFEL